MKFQGHGRLTIKSKDGRNYGVLEFLGGTVFVTLGTNVKTGGEGLISGKIEVGPKGMRFIVEKIENAVG